MYLYLNYFVTGMRHALRMSNARCECEVELRKYFACNNIAEDRWMLPKIYRLFDDCNPKDQQKLIGFVKANKDKVEKKIKELEQDIEMRKTSNFCIFTDRDTKRIRLSNYEYSRTKYDRFLSSIQNNSSVSKNRM